MTDTELLNWLEQHPEFSLRHHKKRWTCSTFTNYEYNAYKTIREAIEAAANGTWNKS